MNFPDILFLFTHKLIPFVSGLAGIGFIIAFHEFGHFMFCKIFNIKTPSFSIGFGPRLITKKIGETVFALSAIPLGGYVEIAGSAEVGQGEQADAHTVDDRSFAAKPWIQKFLVMIGGIAFNVFFAYVAISLLYMTGMPQSMILYPKNATATVCAIIPKTPAERAGIKPGDTVISINNISLDTAFGPILVETIQANPNQSVEIVLKDNNSTRTVTLTPEAREIPGKTIGAAGIVFTATTMPPYSIIDSIKKGFQLTNEYILNTINGFKHIFSKRDASMVAGPIGIISETVNGAQQGFKNLLLFLAIISISLAVLNLLPLPILDGGQILFYTIEAIIGQSIPDKVREYIHIACWICFLVLALYLSYKDIMNLIHPYIERILTMAGWGK